MYGVICTLHLTTNEEKSVLAFDVERWWTHDFNDHNPHDVF